jgi:hypothetical protein
MLVEGDDDKRVLPYFMEAFIPWGKTESEWPVRIEQFGGIENVLKPGVIEAELKASGLVSLGIVVDANDDPLDRWRRIRARCIGEFPSFPEGVDPNGLILENESGLRLGVWLMPDNKARGMLETFLSLFVPPTAEPLWQFAKECCVGCQGHQAPFKAAHLDKAHIHTWLAWQDPPGQSLHLAVMARTLTPGSPNADAFVGWFRKLYRC